MKPAPDQTSPAGRPRDPRIDAAILAATAELLLEVGYPGVTIAAVAARAGTTTPAIYRRWTSKAHLVHEAAFPYGERDRAAATPEPLPATSAAMVRGAAEAVLGPGRAGRPAGPAGRDRAPTPTCTLPCSTRFQDGVWGAMQDRLSQATSRARLAPASTRRRDRD